LRRQSAHKQSPPSSGTGSFALSSAHQQSLDKVQANSAPQLEQIRRRAAGAGIVLRWLISGSPFATP
jgi:hypothetical protein